LLLAALTLVAACGEDTSSGTDVAVVAADAHCECCVPDDVGPPTAGWDCDIKHVALAFDVGKRTAKGVYELGAGCDLGITLSVGNLEVNVEESGSGAPMLRWHKGNRLDVAWAKAATSCIDSRLTLTWKYQPTVTFNGFMESGSTVLWPDYCGNLYPCHPSMKDGIRYTVKVTGAGAGRIAVHADKVEKDAPAYMPAIAVGDYSWHKLGTTNGGTEVGYWTLPDTAENAKKGTVHLLKHVQWLEDTLGPYPFGKKTGPVAVDWGLQSGGLENHPFWHVSKLGMHSDHIHAHEASHAWFGAGIRLACWEDLAMSEGTADYLAARAIEEVQGKKAAEPVWKAYQAYVDTKIKQNADMVVWPDGCGKIDIRTSLKGQLVYKKGALLWRAVADEVGADKLEAAMGVFFKANVHKAAKLTDLLATVKAQTGFDPMPLAQKFLRQTGYSGS